MNFPNRLQKAQKLLQTYQVEALIIDNPIDIYYLTGQMLSLGRILIEHKQSTLFVDGRYFENCQKNAPLPVKQSQGFGQGSLFEMDFLYRGKTVGFDSLYTTYSGFQSLQNLQAKLIPIEGSIAPLRLIKEPEEIELLQRAATLGDKGYDYLLSQIKPGITEAELALALELFWKKEGAQGLAFAPHIAFGPHSAHPHHHTDARALQKNDIILIDIGVLLDHYHSDMTRVIAIGEPPEELIRIYSIVFEAQKNALALCQPGTVIAEIDLAARKTITEQGYEEQFLHSTGHGIGLEIHEGPRVYSRSQERLDKGMVITIEPGIYLPGVGGIRLEDSVVITENGYETLTTSPLPPALTSIASTTA